MFFLSVRRFLLSTLRASEEFVSELKHWRWLGEALGKSLQVFVNDGRLIQTSNFLRPLGFHAVDIGKFISFVGSVRAARRINYNKFHRLLFRLTSSTEVYSVCFCKLAIKLTDAQATICVDATLTWTPAAN